MFDVKSHLEVGTRANNSWQLQKKMILAKLKQNLANIFQIWSKILCDLLSSLSSHENSMLGSW